MAKYTKGLYKAEITSQRFGVSKNKGTPCFEVDFKVLARFDAATHQEVACEQGNRSATIWLKDGEGFDIALQRLKALGVEGSFSQYDPSRPGYISLAGKEIKVWCKGPNDKGYDEWNVFVPSEKERKPRTSDPNVAMKLDNLFGNKLGGTPAPVPTVDVTKQPLPF